MTLFIGGPLDGQDRHVQEQLNMVTARSYASPRFYSMADALGEQEIKPAAVYRYLRHKLPGDAEIFALSDSSLADALQILIAAYPRKR